METVQDLIRASALACNHVLMLKSARKTLPGRPAVPAPVGQSDVEALRSAQAVSPVGLWPPPRRS